MAYDAEIRVNTKVDLGGFKELEKEKARLEKKLSNLNAKNEMYDVTGAGLQTLKRLDYETEQTKKALEKVNRELATMGNQLGGGEMQKGSNALDKFNKRLLGLAKRVFVFSLIAKGFRSMVAGLKEGLQNIAQFSTEYNSAMSAFKSQTETLKNSLASAFAPIITMALPYLTKLVEWLNKGAEAIAQFFAVLSGKNVYAKAKTQAVDYAKALKQVNKEASKLASFDDINVLQNNDSAGGDIGGAGAFEWAEVDESKFGWVSWLKDNLEIVMGVVATIGTLLLGWKISSLLSTTLGKVGTGIGLIVTGVIGAISIVKEWIKTGDITNSQLGILLASILAIGAGLSLLTGSWIPLVVSAVVALVALVIAKWDEIWGAIKNFWQNVKDWWDSMLQYMKNKFNTFFNSLKVMWKNIKDFFGSIGDGIVDAFENVWTGIKKVINWIVQGIAKMVNGIIGLINKMIDGLNTIGFDLPDWMGGGHFGVSINKIQEVEWKGLALAQGGITNRPTTALIGEAGREAVLPLENNTEWMDVLANKISGGNVTIKFDGDLAQLARVLNPVLANESKRIGTRLVVE